MTKNEKKSPKQQQPTEEIQMADKDIMIITGVKVKYLFLKVNEYGHNNFVNVIDITPLQQLIELRNSPNMPIWDFTINLFKSMV